MKPKIRDILLESPSGKAEDWLSRQKDIEWAAKTGERHAKEKQLNEIFLKKDDNPEHFVQKFIEMRGNRAFANFMESCTHCGICVDKCQMFIATGDVNNTPVGRAELARKMYNKGKRLTPDAVDLEKLYNYYYQCTECRRCSFFCPQGIDQSEITRNIRDILTQMGQVPDYVASTAAQVYKTGNNMGLHDKFLKDVGSFIEQEILEETGKQINVPFDKPKAETLFIPSSADLFTNTDTLKGYIKVMHVLKRDYTFSSYTTEVANFGLFLSEKHLRDFGNRVVEEAVRKGSKTVIWGECGHGWRSADQYVRYELAKNGIELKHIHQVTDDALRRGQIKVDKNKNDDLYNYHDPCNYARGGNLINEPRRVLSAVVRETVEAEYTKEQTFCCGAGGGLLADEKDWNEYRAWAGWPAVYYGWKTGAHNFVSPCAIDKAQFPHVIGYHKVDMVTKGLMDLVGYAIEV
ncbi:MAG: (Fe-S)-binding protein [Thermoplasmataceae archaeon]